MIIPRDIKYEENYIFGIGFLPSLEIVGRLVDAKGYARDLSANIKYKLPYKSEYLPNLAIGVQDFGGSYNFYDNLYIVLDKDIGIFRRLQLGYWVTKWTMWVQPGRKRNWAWEVSWGGFEGLNFGRGLGLEGWLG